MRRGRKKGGWYDESLRHSLAARGIKTRQKTYPRTEFNPPEYLFQKVTKDPLSQKLISRALVLGAINISPVAREIYVGYTTARFVYLTWNSIYNAYKDQDEFKKEAYGYLKGEAKKGLTSYQTDLIWAGVEDRVPDIIKDESKKQLTNVMLNITEEEISLVEQALSAAF